MKLVSFLCLMRNAVCSTMNAPAHIAPKAASAFVVQVWAQDASTAHVADDNATLVEAALNGQNAAAIVMGRSGSGKSHTMQGADWSNEPGALLARYLIMPLSFRIAGWDNCWVAAIVCPRCFHPLAPP